MQTDYKYNDSTFQFYKQRVSKFFIGYMGQDANINKPLDAITYYDIDAFISALRNSGAEIMNVYKALKRFFEYCYIKGATREIMSQVKKPDYQKNAKRYLNDNEYQRIIEYIFNTEYQIYDRLLLGLFLYTGLSRKFIFEIFNSSFIFSQGVYSLSLWLSDDNVSLPLKAELQLLIQEYLKSVSANDMFHRFVHTSDPNTLSTFVSNKTKQIIGRSVTPTIISSTFIKNALSNGNYVYEVSNLVMEKIPAITGHIHEKSADLRTKQIMILNSF